jgi:hypothetical protein
MLHNRLIPVWYRFDVGLIAAPHPDQAQFQKFYCINGMSGLDRLNDSNHGCAFS